MEEKHRVISVYVVPEIDDYVIQTEPKMLVNSKKSEK
jgi:hypothetical protein